MADARLADMRIPLLPQGIVLFVSLPMRAVNLDQLGSAVDSGVAVVRAAAAHAVVLFRDGALSEAVAVDAAGPSEGEAALVRMQSWQDATVSAHRLDAAALDAVDIQLRGDVVYDELYMMWIEWPRLLDDLRTRLRTFVVTLSLPSGGAVVAMRDGEEVFAYAARDSDANASVESLFAARTGVLRVTRPRPAHAARELDSTMLRLFGRPQPALTRDDLAAQRVRTAQARLLDSLAPQLKEVARTHLHRSADRVERIIDDAVAHGGTLDDVAAAVAAASVRGVSARSMHELAAALAAAALPRTADQRFLPA